VGTTVTWTNKDQVEHTVTSDNGIFDSGFLSQNEPWSYTFNEPGTFTYHCEPHPFMTAQVIVE
jgi:plastocyanin